MKPARLPWVLSTVLWYSLLCAGVFELLVLTIHNAAGPNDFCQDYASAVSLLHGHTAYPPVYCNGTFIKLPGSVEYDSHPPTSILLYLPFGLLPKLAAMTLWGVVSLMAYVGSVWLLLRAVHWPVLPGLALFAFGSLFWLPSLYATQVLNMEQVLLLLLVGVWLLSARRQERWAGVLLGIACLLKIWPLLFLFVPLLQRRWRLVTVTGVVVGVGVLLALVVEGPGAFVAYAGPVRVAEEAWVGVAYVGNISLAGAVVGLLLGYTDVKSTAPLLPGIHAGTAVALGEALSALLLIGGIGLVWWKRHSLEDEPGSLVAFSLLLTLILVTFPLSWIWALITLFLPAAMLVLALRRQVGRLPGWWWWLLGASVVILNVDLVLFLIFLPGLPLALLQDIRPHLAIVNQLKTVEEALPTLGLLLFTAAQAYLLARQPVRTREDAAVTVPAPDELQRVTAV